jgi:hypothetical protein
MAQSSGNSVVLRLGEWLAALVGAVNCIWAPLVFAQNQGTLFPLPGLYFIEIALLGILVLMYVAARLGLKGRWSALPWAAAGILLAFVIIAGFSIGPYLIPAVVAFVVAGLLGNWQTGESLARHVGVFLVAAVAQGAVMVVLAMVA